MNYKLTYLKFLRDRHSSAEFNFPLKRRPKMMVLKFIEKNTIPSDKLWWTIKVCSGGNLNSAQSTNKARTTQIIHLYPSGATYVQLEDVNIVYLVNQLFILTVLPRTRIDCTTNVRLRLLSERNEMFELFFPL